MAFTFAEPTDTVQATAGKDYLIYVNTGATEEAPEWTIVGGQRTGDLKRTADSIDASHKTSGGWKTSLPGLRGWEIDLEAVYLIGDKGAKFLEAAFLAGKKIHLKFLYPDRTFVTGWGSITECSLGSPHDDVATITGTIEGAGALSDVQTEEEPKKKVTLRYDRNGGTGDGPADQTVDEGTEVALGAANAYTAPAGKTFKEWNTKADGSGTGKAAGARMTLTDDTTMYAVWQNAQGA